MTIDEGALKPQSSMQRVVSQFVNGLPGRLEAIAQAFQQQQWEELRMLSHKLAGAALFGFPELGACAHSLEKAVTAGNFNEIPEHLKRLNGEWERCAKQTAL